VAGMVMPDDSSEEGRELVYDRASASYHRRDSLLLGRSLLRRKGFALRRRSRASSVHQGRQIYMHNPRVALCRATPV